MAVVAVAVVVVAQREEVRLCVEVVDQREVGLGSTVIHAHHVHARLNLPHQRPIPLIRSLFLGPLLT